METSHSRRSALALMGAAAFAPALARADAPPPADFDQLKAAKDAEARLTTPVLLNGRGPYSFVVDTGSNHSLIADDLARSLDLPAGSSVLINTVAGAQTTSSVLVDTVDLGVRTTRAVVMGVAPREAIGGVGLLGIDQLTDLRLKLDFKENRLAVGESGSRYSDREALQVRARQRSGQLTLVGAEVGGMPLIAFVDSGSQVTIGNLALRKALGAQVKPISAVEAQDIPVIGATGLQTAGEAGFLPVLKMGGLTVRRLAVLFADLHTFHLWGMADEPALLIGVDLLKRFDSVDLDFGRGEVLFRVPGFTPSETGSRLKGGSTQFLHVYGS